VANISYEWKFILYFAVLLSLFTVINLFLPSQYQFINTFDYIWLAGGIIGISASCVLITGAVCTVALAVFGIGTIFNYIVIGTLISYGGINLIKTFLFVPLTVTYIYIVARLGRGGG